MDSEAHDPARFLHAREDDGTEKLQVVPHEIRRFNWTTKCPIPVGSLALLIMEIAHECRTAETALYCCDYSTFITSALVPAGNRSASPGSSSSSEPPSRTTFNEGAEDGDSADSATLHSVSRATTFSRAPRK